MPWSADIGPPLRSLVDEFLYGLFLKPKSILQSRYPKPRSISGVTVVVHAGNESGTILQLIHGLRGSLHVTLEEGTCAAWLHDLLKAHVTQVLVCDPRKNALMKAGNKNDGIDARKLAELL